MIWIPRLNVHIFSETFCESNLKACGLFAGATQDIMNIDSVRDAFEIILCHPQKTCHVESLAGRMILSQKASQSNSPEAICYSGVSTLRGLFQIIVNYRYSLKWPKLIRANDRSSLPTDSLHAFYGQQHHPATQALLMLTFKEDVQYFPQHESTQRRWIKGKANRT